MARAEHLGLGKPDGQSNHAAPAGPTSAEWKNAAHGATS